jgi:hypothetical protein
MTEFTTTSALIIVEQLQIATSKWNVVLITPESNHIQEKSTGFTHFQSQRHKQNTIRVAVRK